MDRESVDLTRGPPIPARTPEDWAHLLAVHAGTLDLRGAIRVLRAAPAEISVCLATALRDICPELLNPANEP